MDKFINVKFIGLLTLFVLTLANVSANHSTVNYSESSEKSVDITQHIKTKEFNINVTPKQVLDKLDSFDTNYKNEIKKNYSKNSLWLYFKLVNNKEKNIEKILSLTSTTSGIVELFLFDKNDNLIYKELGGNSISYQRKKINSLAPAFLLQLKEKEVVQVLIKRTSRHRLDTKVILSDKNVFYEEDQKSKFILVLYAGAILSISLYNFLILLYTRDITYLFYCLFATSLSSLALNLHGALDYFFRLENFVFSKYIFVCSSSSILFMLCFAFYFLKVETSLRKFIKGFKFFASIALIHLLIAFTPLFNAYSNILGLSIDLTIALSLTFVLIVAVTGVIKKNIIAKIYLASFIFIFIGAAIWFGMNLGVFPRNIFTSNSILIANILEMITIALGLAYKITYIDQTQIQIKKEKLSHQKYLRLVRVLSHDISNSLLIITGFSKKVLRSPDLVNKVDTWEKVSRASNNISNILKHVREEIKDEDKSQLILKDVHVNTIINESLFTFNERLENKKITIHNLIDDSLLIYCEPTILQNHIFNNIISNAIKFSKENSSVYILSKEIKDYHVIKVKDSGVGIPPVEINNFMKNKFIDSTPGTDGEEGTGQGMRLLHGYMEKFGGYVELDSVTETEDPIGTGTTVILYFPKVH